MYEVASKKFKKFLANAEFGKIIAVVIGSALPLELSPCAAIYFYMHPARLPVLPRFPLIIFTSASRTEADASAIEADPPITEADPSVAEAEVLVIGAEASTIEADPPGAEAEAPMTGADPPTIGASASETGAEASAVEAEASTTGNFARRHPSCIETIINTHSTHFFKTI